jgi:hypothetical protein
MKKTSVYLSDADLERLAWLAEEEGKSQAEIVRLAIGEYQPCRPPKRHFYADGCVEGDGSDVADIPEEVYLKGFGSDSYGE